MAYKTLKDQLRFTYQFYLLMNAVGRDEEAKQPFGRSREQEERNQDDAEIDVPLGYDPNAVAHARDRGQGRNDGDDGDQDDLGHCPGVDAEEHVQPRRHLTDAETEGRGNAEYGPEHREKVDRVTEGAVDSVAYNRIERRAKCQR